MNMLGAWPGRIVKYYHETQLADIIVCTQNVYADSETTEGSSGRHILTKVPVHTPFGGGWSITFDIKEGDTCTLMFSQKGYDHWLFDDLNSAPDFYGHVAPHLQRSFSEDDGFAIVGFNTIPRAITNYSTDGSQWRNVDAVQNIHLKADGSIAINTAVTLDITAPLTNINGDVVINGNLDVSGVTTGPSGVFGGIAMETHDHPGDGGTGSGPSTGLPRNT